MPLEVSINGLGELITAIGLVTLLWAETRRLAVVKAISKTVASLGFLVAAFGFGAFDSTYGQLVFLGLFLGAIGDVCLLSDARKLFVAGLVVFLLGHLAYVIAFASLGIAIGPTIVAIVILAPALVSIARWLRPHVKGLAGPILGYMFVIGVMVTTAAGAWGLGAPWMIPVGATMFAVSDLAVVRHRFVTPALSNKWWGLPLYYAAQLLIAWSIAAL